MPDGRPGDLPDDSTVRTVMIETLMNARRRMSADDLHDEVSLELGLNEDYEDAYDLIDRILNAALDAKQISQLPEGDLVVPARLCLGIVLTTRVTEHADWPPLDTDLVGFTFLIGLEEDLVDAEPPNAGRERMAVARHEPGGITISVEPARAPTAEEVAAIRRAYDSVWKYAGLPVSFSDLLINVLAEDGHFFDEPRAPLSEIVTAAGLEARGNDIGHDESVWRADRRQKLFLHVITSAGSHAERSGAMQVAGVFDQVASGRRVATEELRDCLDVLTDVGSALLLSGRMLAYDDPVAQQDVDAFVTHLSAAASSPMHRGVVGWWRARLHELRYDPLAAADVLAETVREAPGYALAIDRLAWTRSDQGRAAEAIALWRLLDLPDSGELEVVEQAPRSGHKPCKERTSA